MGRSILIFALMVSSLHHAINAIQRHKKKCRILEFPGSESFSFDWYQHPSLWMDGELSHHHCGNMSGMAVKYSCPLIGCTANCRNMHLSDIPTNLPVWIKRLNIHGNNITAIRNRSLSKYINLDYLDLSNNAISRLYSESFFGLSKLTLLNLRFNNLTYVNVRFPPNVFKPLHRLVTLCISKNNPDPTQEGLVYPADELSTLTSLENLYMDGLKNPNISSAFQKLTALNTLSLSGYLHGYCHLSGLNNEMFINVPQVRCLYLISCFMQGKNIQSKTFEPLKQLEYLDLTHNEDIGMENLPTLFSGLRNTTTLRHLGLHLIVPRYSLGICLSIQSLLHFPPSVETLHAQENSLQAVGKGVIPYLPKGLKELDLSGNEFVFGKYIRDLYKLESLRTLKLNGRRFIYQLPKKYPFQPHSLASIPDSLSERENCQLNYDHNDTLVVRLPPALVTLEMKNAGLLYRLTEIHFDKRNVLKEVFLTGNRFPSLEGPLFGLHSLRSLDLSSCFIKEIQSTFFANLSSLTELRLNNNELARFFKTSRSSKVFSGLHSLTSLDLSYNSIEKLTEDVFYGLNKLKHLLLKGNLIHQFTSEISHMSNLQILNLNSTLIPNLNKDTRHSVDNLIQRGVSLRVDMSKTPISCDCQNLDFLEWMVHSKAFDSSFKQYRCDYNDLVLEELTDGYTAALGFLNKECTSHVYLLLVVSLSVTLILVILIVTICYRFRWNLRYLYHMAYLQYKKETKNNSDEFEFDVFVCYANDDQDFVVDILEQELVRRGLRVHVHGRDFVAGEYISSNIIHAVCRSRKTLVVLTSDMLKSKWCNYEIQMANMEAVHTGRKVLVFLLKGSNSMTRDNMNIFYNIQINTYLEYPSPEEASDEQMQAMWSKLTRDLRN